MSKGTKIVLIIGGIVLALVVAVPAILGAVTGYRYLAWGWRGMGPGMMYGWDGGWLMGIVMVLFWVLIIGTIAALVRYFGGRHESSLPENSAIEILKRRYAQGEINRDEYEEKKKELV
jgi:putative membrane protein